MTDARERLEALRAELSQQGPDTVRDWPTVQRVLCHHIDAILDAMPTPAPEGGGRLREEIEDLLWRRNNEQFSDAQWPDKLCDALNATARLTQQGGGE